MPPWRLLLAAVAVQPLVNSLAPSAASAPAWELRGPRAAHSLVRLRGKARLFGASASAKAAGASRLMLSAEATRLVKWRENAAEKLQRLANTQSNKKAEEMLGVGERSQAATQNCGSKPSTYGMKGYHVFEGQSVERWIKLKKQISALPVSGPKLMVLMTIYRSITFPQTWQAFLEAAPKGSASMLIHSVEKNPKLPDFFLRFLLEEQIKSERCNVISLLIRMMSIGLRDTSVTHFAVVSGDSLPLRSMHVIRGDLDSEPRTRFCVDAEWERAETWIVLQRDHAQLVASHQRAFSSFIGSQTFSCPDEEAWYTALLSRNESFVDKCQTFTDWAATTKAWRRVARYCACPSFLVSEKVQEASCARPAVRSKVTRSGLEELIASPGRFWFARKFTGDGDDMSGVTISDGDLVEPLDSVMSLAMLA